MPNRQQKAQRTIAIISIKTHRRKIVIPVNKADICMHQIVVNIIKMIQRHTAAKPIYTNQKLIKPIKLSIFLIPKNMI